MNSLKMANLKHEISLQEIKYLLWDLSLPHESLSLTVPSSDSLKRKPP